MSVWLHQHFEKAYEQLLLDYAIDYTSVNHKNIDEKKIAAFFAPRHFNKTNIQQ